MHRSLADVPVRFSFLFHMVSDAAAVLNGVSVHCNWLNLLPKGAELEKYALQYIYEGMIAIRFVSIQIDFVVAFF